MEAWPDLWGASDAEDSIIAELANATLMSSSAVTAYRLLYSHYISIILAGHRYYAVENRR